jgi:hypothetical protein
MVVVAKPAECVGIREVTFYTAGRLDSAAILCGCHGQAVQK